MTRSQLDSILGSVGTFFAKVGIPAGVLVMLMLMVWAAASTLHESVVVPMVETTTDFIRATQKTQERQAETLEAISDGKDQQTEILQEIAAGQKELHAEIRALVAPKQ